MFLAGFAVPYGSKVGIIQRRLIGATASLSHLFTHMAECDVRAFNHIQRQWQRADKPDRPILDMSLLNFPALSKCLHHAGFIKGHDWTMPLDTEVEEDLSKWSAHFGCGYIEKDIVKSER